MDIQNVFAINAAPFAIYAGEYMDKTSMRWWYPQIKELNIPMPRTEIIPLRREEDLTAILANSGADFFTEEGLKEHVDLPKIEAACEKIGYPVFIRSDFTSHKHDWEKSCFVERKEDIVPHLNNIIQFSLLADIFGGIPFTAVIVREYIKMAELFTAFHGRMPVNPEWRFFVDRKVLCSHWYWVEEAIERPSIRTWKNRMFKAREASLNDGGHNKCETHAWTVGTLINGCWSIDFCLGADGTWYLIDMAQGYKSWHPEYCPKHGRIKEIG